MKKIKVTLVATFLSFYAIRSLWAFTFVVTTNADSGPGSLRWAIQQANSFLGRDEIVFDIHPRGSPALIQPTNALPPITDSVILDGWTQLGSPSCQPGVELNGSLAGSNANGLQLGSTNCIVRGLCINSFAWNGIALIGGGDHQIYGCFIGTDLSGTLDQGNGLDGIFIDSSSRNQIGLEPLDSCTNRNVISGNGGCGVRMVVYMGVGTPCSQNVLQNNYIGVDVLGQNPLPNDANGVHLEGPMVMQNFIGSIATPKPVNIISANGSNGVYIIGASGNYIQGNTIGLDRTGTSALGNQLHGIHITNGASTLIGEIGGEGQNVISGNGGDGIRIDGSLAAGNNVFGNLIGVASNGLVAVPNQGDGIHLAFDAQQNRIGEADRLGARNIISGNARSGIRLTSNAHGNFIYYNIIGLDRNGVDKIGNQRHGIHIDSVAYGNYIGQGLLTNSGNIIAGNGTNEFHHGICVENGAASNEVAQNVIGLNAFGFPEGNAGDGIRLQDNANGNIIGGYSAEDGNVISGNRGCGIHIGPNVTDTRVVGNIVGLDRRALEPRPNKRSGILIFRAHANRIGISTAAAPNIISGNLEHGVVIEDNDKAYGNVVEFNWIGTDGSGAAGAGNQMHGIYIRGAPSNWITSASGPFNVVAGNAMDGIRIEGPTAVGNIVAGNYIGLERSGANALSNGEHGIAIIDAPENWIGHPFISGNVVSGNRGDGIHIEGVLASRNYLNDNSIGDSATSTNSAPNGGDGVYIGGGASDTKLGFMGTVISVFNEGAGIRIESGSNNLLWAVCTYENRGLGIDLGPQGPTPNDVLDLDNGANFLQNAPVLYEATTGSVILAGLLNSIPNTEYTIQFYEALPPLDPSGYGEGTLFLGSITVTTAPDGNIIFEANLPVSMDTGTWITATATDPWGNTSEFANNIEVVPNELFGDPDGDGMPTRWELPKGLDPYDPTGDNGADGDPDGDGVSNWEEYVADSEPRDPGNYLHFVEIVATNEVRVTYTSTNTRYYAVSYTENPTDGSSWIPLYPLSVPGSNGVTSATDPLGATTRLYRVAAQLLP